MTSGYVKQSYTLHMEHALVFRFLATFQCLQLTSPIKSFYWRQVTNFISNQNLLWYFQCQNWRQCLQILRTRRGVPNCPGVTSFWANHIANCHVYEFYGRANCIAKRIRRKITGCYIILSQSYCVNRGKFDLPYNKHKNHAIKVNAS